MHGFVGGTLLQRGLVEVAHNLQKVYCTLVTYLVCGLLNFKNLF